MTTLVPAKPGPFAFEPETTALVVIDMQRDFLEPGGFGAMLGNDVALLSSAIEPLQKVLAAARGLGMTVIHTREGHRPDLTDAPPSKLARGGLECGIGDAGPNGRILVRGERGHDIVDALAPAPGEVVLDKPGKGSFYATDLELMLRNRAIKSLIVTGVTTEVCVHTTVREANDRGFECLVLSDCSGSYFPEFHEVALRMIAAQGGIFGWVGTSADLLEHLPVNAVTGA
jgi:nicotinamidase-related amidase